MFVVFIECPCAFNSEISLKVFCHRSLLGSVCIHGISNMVQFRDFGAISICDIKFNSNPEQW
jgi:hypothetical protein